MTLHEIDDSRFAQLGGAWSLDKTVNIPIFSSALQ